VSSIGRPTSNPDVSDRDDDIDFGELDSELDSQLELNLPTGDQRIPDCVVESVMNEDHCGYEKHAAFSGSIGQRVRRERKGDFLQYAYTSQQHLLDFQEANTTLHWN